ncbi:MAG: S8 family serine peptidase [Prevotella sp.]|nr:S8 family serine peptidase [Prevotella sp.]
MRPLLNISLLLLLSILTASAQDYSKMSSYVRRLVAGGAVLSKASPTPSTRPITLTLVQGEESAIKGHCLRHQGDIHIVASTIDQLAEMSAEPSVARIEARECNSEITLHDASTHVDVTDVWQGTGGLPQAFRGKGCVIGLSDIGFDLTHPAFRNDDGTLRISRFWDFLNIPDGKTYSETDPYPIGTYFDNKDEILALGSSADGTMLWHGTHTLGIAAGNPCDTEMQGMAPEADLYVCNTLTSNNYSQLPENLKKYYNETFQLLAFQYMFDYADEQGKPCVVSYSIGGPQSINDGDLLTLEYINRMTEKPGHIFVATAGNNGTTYGYLPKSSTQTTVGGAIQTSHSKVYFGISAPKTLTIRLTNYGLTTPVSRDISLDMPLNAKEGAISPSGLKYGEANTIEMGDDFNGLKVMIYPLPDPFREGRMSYDMVLSDGALSANSGKYVMEFIGEETEADIFAQNANLRTTSYDTSLTGAQASSANVLQPGSLEPVIGVGATTWRESYTDINGNSHSISYGSDGRRVSFSGCGPAISGLTKPDIMAPGIAISSAANSFYTFQSSKLTASTTYDGKTYYWTVSDGTSMATPMVAGIIALWLEADPTLTRQRILDVFAHTANHYDTSLSYPNDHYGYGEINAYKGLLYILNLTDVEGISTTHAQGATILPAAGGSIRITFDNPLPHSTNVRAYTTDGKMVAGASLAPHSTEHRLSLPSGIHGIIAVQLDGYGSTLIRM